MNIHDAVNILYPMREPTLKMDQEPDDQPLRVNLTLNQDQADALDKFKSSLQLPRVSNANAALALLVEALQARKLLPRNSEPPAAPTKPQLPASSRTALD